MAATVLTLLGVAIMYGQAAQGFAPPSPSPIQRFTSPLWNHKPFHRVQARGSASPVLSPSMQAKPEQPDVSRRSLLFGAAAASLVLSTGPGAVANAGDLQQVRDPKVLVVGARGPLGTSVLRSLRKNFEDKGLPCSIRCMTRDPVKAKKQLQGADLPSNLEFFQGDLLQLSVLEDTMDGVTHVIFVPGAHFVPGGDAQRLIFRDSVAELAKVAKKSDRFQRFTLCATFANPATFKDIYNPTYRARIEGEAALVESGVPYTVVRPLQFGCAQTFLDYPDDESPRLVIDREQSYGPAANFPPVVPDLAAVLTVATFDASTLNMVFNVHNKLVKDEDPFMTIGAQLKALS